jgi:periplasmic divalent cation tolerance protein
VTEGATTEGSAFIFAYTTTPTYEKAREIAQDVVERGLAACANIIPTMTSVYCWQGKVEEAQEVVLILKTARARFEELSARIKALHPYECPCIIGLPLAAGSLEYLNWMRVETEVAL